jgi:hypothetical protein
MLEVIQQQTLGFEQVKMAAAIHDALDDLDLVHRPFGQAIAIVGGKSISNGDYLCRRPFANPLWRSGRSPDPVSKALQFQLKSGIIEATKQAGVAENELHNRNGSQSNHVVAGKCRGICVRRQRGARY